MQTLSAQHVAHRPCYVMAASLCCWAAYTSGINCSAVLLRVCRTYGLNPKDYSEIISGAFVLAVSLGTAVGGAVGAHHPMAHPIHCRPSPPPSRFRHACRDAAHEHSPCCDRRATRSGRWLPARQYLFWVCTLRLAALVPHGVPPRSPESNSRAGGGRRRAAGSISRGQAALRRKGHISVLTPSSHTLPYSTCSALGHSRRYEG